MNSAFFADVYFFAIFYRDRHIDRTELRMLSVRLEGVIHLNPSIPIKRLGFPYFGIGRAHVFVKGENRIDGITHPGNRAVRQVPENPETLNK